MTILEGYQRVLDAAEELRRSGIPVAITPTQQDDAKDAPLPREKWVIIVFTVKTADEVAAINKKADLLGAAGIVFDMSGGKDDREWEVDWSLKVLKKPDKGWEHARAHMEKTLEA